MGLSPHTRTRLITRNGKKVRAHRWIMEQRLGRKLLPDEQVHHKNGDPLDNRLENLQLISHRENVNKDIKSSSNYNGVSWYKRYNKWVSRINISNKRIFLGYFENEIEANNAYQKALKELTETGRLL